MQCLHVTGLTVFKWVTLFMFGLFRFYTRLNAGAVSNRSTIVGILVQSHDRYVKLTRDVVV